MDAFAPLDAAIDSVVRLRASLSKGKTSQVRSLQERLLVKATAQAWFNSQKPQLVALNSDPLLTQISQVFATLLAWADQNTTRAKYLDVLKGAKADLVALRSRAALSPPPNTAQKPRFDALIADAQMLAILERRWSETLACLNAAAPLAATVMMGGLLEALLLARINALPNQAPVYTAKAAPKDKQGKTRSLKEWGLKDYLDVAHELGWIRQSAKDVGQVLRDYRNYVHPEKERSQGLSVDSKDASMFLVVFASLAEQIIGSV